MYNKKIVTRPLRWPSLLDALWCL